MWSSHEPSARGDWVWGGVSPSERSPAQRVRAVWEGGCAPSSEFFCFQFGPQNGQFRCKNLTPVGDASPIPLWIRHCFSFSLMVIYWSKSRPHKFHYLHSTSVLLFLITFTLSRLIGSRHPDLICLTETWIKPFHHHYGISSLCTFQLHLHQVTLTTLPPPLTADHSHNHTGFRSSVHFFWIIFNHSKTTLH